MDATKDFKSIDCRIINCNVTDTHIIMSSGVFKAKYKHTEVNNMIELHSKILSERTMKEVQKFINQSREPEQLSLF